MSFERKHPILRGIFTALSLVSLALPSLAYAQQTGEGKVEKVVVRNRLHHSQGKWEVSPGIGFSLTNQMTEHTNFELGLAYNAWETFAFEVRGGYALGSLSSVGEQIQDDPRNLPNAQDLPDDDFADTWQLQWQALFLPRWQPIYGKLNLVTELPVHFQGYVTAGGGMVGLHRESPIYRQAGNAFLEEDRMSPALAGGGGFRFFVNDWAALKIEMLAVGFPDQYREGFKPSQTGAEPAGSDPQAGAEASSPGLSSVLFLNIGTSFRF